MEDKLSNWEIQKSKSVYHFNSRIIDHRWDSVQGLGKFTGNWTAEVDKVIKTAKPATWRTRSETGTGGVHVEQEEYDLINAGMAAETVISNLEYNLDPIFKKMCDLIGLSNRIDRVHVQWPGQVFSKHIDKLEKMNPDNPDKVMRIMVMLTDWDPGHFNQYGNYTYSQWSAGDIHTFDWKNVPHSSANASLIPRVSLLTTGTITDTTLKFLADTKHSATINLN